MALEGKQAAFYYFVAMLLLDDPINASDSRMLEFAWHRIGQWKY